MVVFFQAGSDLEKSPDSDRAQRDRGFALSSVNLGFRPAQSPAAEAICAARISAITCNMISEENCERKDASGQRKQNPSSNLLWLIHLR